MSARHSRFFHYSIPLQSHPLLPTTLPPASTEQSQAQATGTSAQSHPSPPPGQPASYLEHQLISHRKCPVQLPRERVDFLLKFLCVRQDLAETRVAISPCLGAWWLARDGTHVPVLTSSQGLCHSLCWGGWGRLYVTIICWGVLKQLYLSETIQSLCNYPIPVCPHDPPIRATVAHLSDLFLLLPDVAHNLQDALGIGQPGHIFWQTLQLRHLDRNMAGMSPSPTPHPP